MNIPDIIDQFMQLKHSGENVSIDSFIAQWPEHQTELKEMLPLALQLDEYKKTVTLTQAMIPLSQVDLCAKDITTLLKATAIQKGRSLIKKRKSHTVPNQIGKYRKVGEIGSGGMSDIFKFIDTETDRLVALKIHRNAKYVREADILKRLQHENIVTCLDTGRNDNFAYTVLEYVDGDNLNNTNWKTLFPDKTPDQAAAIIILQAARGLAYAHSQGIVHQDVKPENILISQNGSVRLSDFDLAVIENSSETQPVGRTEKYEAPEHKKLQIITPKCDQYSLGKTFSEMLDKKNSSRALFAIAQKATFENPDDRYESLDVMADEIENWLNADLSK